MTTPCISFVIFPSPMLLKRSPFTPQTSAHEISQVVATKMLIMTFWKKKKKENLNFLKKLSNNFLKKLLNSLETAQANVLAWLFLRIQFVIIYFFQLYATLYSLLNTNLLKNSTHVSYCIVFATICSIENQSVFFVLQKRKNFHLTLMM